MRTYIVKNQPFKNNKLKTSNRPNFDIFYRLSDGWQQLYIV